ncbi:MAG: hypothetical protein IKP10_05185 [Clostridia bacterium]|nr:hypothetical protein [Clostridia bacterium]
MTNEQKPAVQPRKRILLTAALIVAVIAFLAVAGILLSRSGEGKNAPEATADPYAVMESLWGDWEQADGRTAGILGLSLHGDGTAVYTRKDVFDEQPANVSARWQAQDGTLTLITGEDDMVQFTLTLDGDTMVLGDSVGTSAAYRRVTDNP